MAPNPATPNLNSSNLEELAQIVELQQEVATAQMDVLALMKLICQKSQLLTVASGAVVEMLEGDEMVYRACHGTLENSLGVRLKANSSLSGMSVRQNEVLHCLDSEADSRVDREACRRVGARSMICVPLQHENAAIGVLKVVSSDPNAFNERQVNSLRLIGGLLSAAVAQAKYLEAAREAASTKAAFMANVSHEIRTPLNGVIGVTQLLLETNLDKQQREYVEIVERSADSLLTLVNDVLDFSKNEAAKTVFEKIDFDLARLVEETRQALSFSAEKNGLRLACYLTADLPRVFNGDPTRIRQVLSNLVNNAIKFTQKGSVTVRVSQYAHHKGTDSDRVELRFEIEDTGIGIPQEAVARLFKPFSQVDSSTTRQFGGTGLGLSISKQLVNAMEGDIGVESTLGKGSIFWFTIVLTVASAVAIAPEPAKKSLSEQLGRQLNILIAEDNSINLLIATKMVEKMGHIPTAVKDGKAALQEIRTGKYDLVLMDGQMPEMDGYEATMAVRDDKGKPWSTIPIVAMTASAMQEDREHCLNVGMNDYVSKPARFEDVVAAIERVLEATKSSKVA